jgi:hypothetical protein
VTCFDVSGAEPSRSATTVLVVRDVVFNIDRE